MSQEAETLTMPQARLGPSLPPRHFVERVSLPGEFPLRYKRTALCGAEVSQLVQEHNGEVCQACVDEQQRILRLQGGPL